MLRLRTVLPVVLALLACTGVVEPVEDDEDIEAPGRDDADWTLPGLDPPRRGKKGKKPDKGDDDDEDDGASPAPSPAPAPGGPAPPGAAPSGIEDLGGDTWRVDSGLVDRWQSNPDRLAQASQVSGGVELRKVRDRDAYHLGLRNKDVVTTINGYTLRSTAEILVAVAALDGEDELTVKVKRDGSTRTHTYLID